MVFQIASTLQVFEDIMYFSGCFVLYLPIDEIWQEMSIWAESETNWLYHDLNSGSQFPSKIQNQHLALKGGMVK